MKIVDYENYKKYCEANLYEEVESCIRSGDLGKLKDQYAISDNKVDFAQDNGFWGILAVVHPEVLKFICEKSPQLVEKHGIDMLTAAVWKDNKDSLTFLTHEKQLSITSLTGTNVYEYFFKMNTGLQNKDYAIFLRKKGDSLVTDGNFEEAKKYYEVAVDICPKYYVGYLHLGDCLLSIGQSHKNDQEILFAAEQYKTALEIKADYAYAHKKLGYLYDLLDKPEDSVKHYIAAIETKGQNIKYESVYLAIDAAKDKIGDAYNAQDNTIYNIKVEDQQLKEIFVSKDKHQVDISIISTEDYDTEYSQISPEWKFEDITSNERIEVGNELKWQSDI